jgi:hypothetical protein
VPSFEAAIYLASNDDRCLPGQLPVEKNKTIFLIEHPVDSRRLCSTDKPKGPSWAE